MPLEPPVTTANCFPDSVFMDNNPFQNMFGLFIPHRIFG